jgi:hypothetical protein
MNSARFETKSVWERVSAVAGRGSRRANANAPPQTHAATRPDVLLTGRLTQPCCIQAISPNSFWIRA